MTTKKPAQNPVELLAHYVHAVWIDFDNVEEMVQLNKSASAIKEKKIKPKKK